MFVSPVLITSSTNRRVDHFHPTRYLSHLLAGIFYCMPLSARWNFLLPAAEKNNNAAKFFVSLKQNNSEGFIGAPSFFLALKRDQISLYVEYSRT